MEINFFEIRVTLSGLGREGRAGSLRAGDALPWTTIGGWLVYIDGS